MRSACALMSRRRLMVIGSFEAGPDDGMRRSAAHRLKLGQHHRQFIRRVLGAEQNPVEPGISEDLDDPMARSCATR
jgi:hypothetical protein